MTTRYGSLASDADWAVLDETASWLSGGTAVENIRSTFRSLGAQAFILEERHIDRDFSAAFSSFYASLFTPYQKLCRRLHFFSVDVSALLKTGADAQSIAEGLQSLEDEYLGFVVLRPLQHAPIGICVISADDFADEMTTEISIQATYAVHLLGAELQVRGVPMAQQDTRVGACAQATIWTVGRHFHTRHGGPWFSMPDISELALRPTDATISQSLPAGSAFLTLDNMVRALKGMERHPVVYARQQGGAWETPPREVVHRYLDSGIPVILGLRNAGGGVGHAVVAVGRENNPKLDTSALGANPTLASGLTHLYVTDDQRGAYCRLPVAEADRTKDYPWTLEADCVYLIVPLPAKVFMPAEHPDLLARDHLKSLLAQRDIALAQAGAAQMDPASLDAEFEKLADNDGVVSRTYLTYGWRYRSRVLRNGVSDLLKARLLAHALPRFVWVTEFSKPADSFVSDPCKQTVLAHVVHDATGSQFWNSALVAELPGFSILWSFESSPDRPQQMIEIIPTGNPSQSWPKKRGWTDFSACNVPSGGV